VVSARKADGARPRQKTQHRMRSDTKENEHKRLDHRARSAPERRNERKRNADLFEYARCPQSIHSYTLRSKTQDVHNPDPGKDGRRGAGARQATVPDAGSWWPLPRIKGPPSTGREIWSLVLCQLGLKLPNTSVGTYLQIFKSPIDVLKGSR